MTLILLHKSYEKYFKVLFYKSNLAGEVKIWQLEKPVLLNVIIQMYHKYYMRTNEQMIHKIRHDTCGCYIE